MLLNANAGTLPRGFAFTAPYCYKGRVRVWINVKPVIASFQNCERLIGRVNLIYFATIEMPDMQIHRALMQRQLHGIVADIGERQTCF